MADDSITLNQLKTYSLSGKIDKEAASLSFGMSYRQQGIFYFDDFKLFIEDSIGIMQ